MKLFLKVVLSVLFCYQSLAVEQENRTGGDVFDVNISCPTGEGSEKCFRHREALYKKLGCHLKEEKCEQMDIERAYSDKGITLCHYKSSNCLEGKKDGSCSEEFSPRWLEGKGSMVICVKPNKKEQEKFSRLKRIGK